MLVARLSYLPGTFPEIESLEGNEDVVLCWVSSWVNQFLYPGQQLR